MRISKGSLVFLFLLLLCYVGCTPEDKANGEDGPKTIHVTSVTLDQKSLTITEGESKTLIASVLPENASNKSISWSSNNNAVASVQGGLITGITAGNAIITVTTEDGMKTATCSIIVAKALAPAVTIDAGNISAISAVLKGKANLGSSTAADLRVGFQYSKSAGILPSNSTTVDAEDSDADYNYTTGITGLEPSTTYYFRSFVRQNGLDAYGETKQFQTKDIASLIHTQEVSAVSAISGRMNASYDLTDVQCTEKSFGFYWGTSATSLPTKVAAEGDGAIYIDLSGLNPSKPYYYQAYAVLDGKELKDEIVSFTTKDVQSLLETRDASDVEAATATLNAKLDLSDASYNDIKYGFYWGISADCQETFLSGGDIKDNAFSSIMTNLPHKTQYWYYAYVMLDEQAFSGEVKSFTTTVVPVESVSLDKEEDAIHTIRNTLTLQATVLPADATDKSVNWTSSDESIATVDNNGIVTAIGNGTATITVTTTDQEKTASCIITVAQYITGISLDKTSLSLNEGENYTFTANITPENAANKTLIWTSSDPGIATVDDKGVVTAVSKGTVTIKAEAMDGSGKETTCSILVNRLVSDIILDKTSLVLFRSTSDISDTIHATVYPIDANITDIEWRSSNESIATVSSSGVVTGLSPGHVIITVKAKDISGIEASCEVEVKQYVTSISFWSTSVNYYIVGDSWRQGASIAPDNATNKNLTWSSDNSSIAVVDEDGLVKATGKGTATITASSNDGSGTFGSYTVIISNPCPKGAVDLGLKTADGYRLYWATSNLSTEGLCANPHDPGDYFAWGETEPKSIYDWANYKWCNGSSSSLTKYNTKSSYGAVDNLTSFEDADYQDDAARQILGGNWRIPTQWDNDELGRRCRWTWTSNYNGTGIAGMIVTSLVTYYTNNSIFLPARGYRKDDFVFYNWDTHCYDGYYWISSIHWNVSSNKGDTYKAYIRKMYKLAGYTYDTGESKNSEMDRCFGLLIRPVSD